jgi:hypothetical protein
MMIVMRRRLALGLSGGDKGNVSCVGEDICGLCAVNFACMYVQHDTRDSI